MEAIERAQQELVRTINEEKEKLKKEKEALEEEKAAWEKAATKLNQTALPQRIRLDVGGKIFATSRQTLVKDKDSYFGSMFGGRFDAQPEEDGTYFIDRDPEVFSYILNFLRGQELKLKFLSERKFALLREDADFYQVRGLTELLGEEKEENKLQQLPVSYTWKPGPNYTVTEGGKKVVANASSWNVTAIGNVLPQGVSCSWGFRVDGVDATNYIMAGVAPENIDQNQSANHNKSGYYFYCYNGSLYSPDGQGTAFAAKIERGNTLTVSIDTNNGVSFHSNGKLLGKPFTLPQGVNYVPCVCIYKQNSSVTFV